MLYAVGDMHGEVEKLDALLGKLSLEARDRLVFLGDYVDRGSDSRGVIDRLIALRESHDCVFLLGNHESMFLDFLGWRDPSYFGGDAFLIPWTTSSSSAVSCSITRKATISSFTPG